MNIFDDVARLSIPIFQRIIEIARMYDSQYNDTIFQEFRELWCNTFTFVYSWDDPSITPDVYCILDRKKSPIEAYNMYITNVKSQLNNSNYVEIVLT